MDRRILIVEDHISVRKSLREWLELTLPAYQMLEAASGEEAVTIAKDSTPSLVLMDIGLPGISGIEAAQAIRELVPSVQVVMLTVFDDDDHRAHAAAVGARAYVAKRKVKTELLPVIKSILEQQGESPSHDWAPERGELGGGK